MPERSSSGKPGPKDLNEMAARIVEEATSEPDEAADEGSEAATAEDGKNAAAVELGRLGGKKGGKARAERLTPEERSEIARRAARARWAGRDAD